MTEMEPTIDELITAAKAEDWEKVDDSVSKVCNDPTVVEWSLSVGLVNSNENLRDLAVTLLEKSDYELKPEDNEKLTKVMILDENEHVRNRATFTLFAHGERSDLVINGLTKALEDSEVKDIAQNYLDSLKNNL